MPKIHPKIRFLLKILLAAALLTWIFKSGKLDAASFTFLMSSPLYLGISYTILFLAALVMGSLRFRMMLGLCEVNVPYIRALRYQGVGLFANVFMPSAVGGDALKAYYVKSDYPRSSIPKIFLAVMLDRIVGMMSIFLVGITVAFVDLNKILALADLRMLFYLNIALFSAVFSFFVVCYFVNRYQSLGEAFLLKLEQRIPFLHKLFLLVKNAAIMIGRNPRVLLLTTLISVGNQLLLIILFWLITKLFGQQDIAFSTVALIYPIGSLILVIPLTPGGLGVGHLAFDKLFSLFGYRDGANYFNIYFLSGVFFYLTMVVFYLGHKKIKNIPTTESIGSEHADV